MRMRGNFWGPNFALIHQFSVETNNAAGSIRTPLEGSRPPLTIHPTTLDSIIHTSLVLFAFSQRSGPTFPISIEELSISTNSVRISGSDLAFVTSSVPVGPFSAVFNVFAFSDLGDSTCRPFVRIKNGILRGTEEISNLKGTLASCGEDHCYQLEWAIDVDLCPSAVVSHPLSEFLDEQQARDKVCHLDDIALFHVDSCLHQIDELEVSAQQSRLYEWMKKFQQSQHQKILQGLDFNLQDRLSLAGVEGEALDLIGSNLSSILTRRSDPLALLLQDGLLSRLYREDPASQKCFSFLVEYVKGVCFKHPGIRLLEIGAGTGGATLPLLQALGDNRYALESYDFTDVSSSFFEDAKVQFQQWKHILHYKTLNIEQDPIQQGFTEKSYDLVVAYNAMHVTRSVDEALKHTTKLLKPGGRVILIEITQLSPYVNVIFGSLLGWFSDRVDGRVHDPILSADQWHMKLLQASFSGVEFSAKDYNFSAHKLTMMVSKAISDEALPIAPYTIQLLAHPKSPLNPDRLLRGLNDKLKSSQSTFSTCRASELSADSSKGDSSDNVLYITVEHEEYSKTAMLQPRAFDIRPLKEAKNVLRISTYEVLGFAPLTNVRSCPSAHQIALSPSTRLVTLDICDFRIEDHSSVESVIFKILVESFLAPAVEQAAEKAYLIKNNAIFIRRLRADLQFQQRVRDAIDPQVYLQSFTQPDRPLKLCLDSFNDRNRVVFIDDKTLQKPVEPDEIEVCVQVFGFSHFQQQSWKQPKCPPEIVGEFSGTVTATGANTTQHIDIGDRVCGFGGTPFANRVRLQASNLHLLPPSIPYSVGASIPVSFVTAYYLLEEFAHLRRGQFVLIYAAHGSIGQAAVRIAQYIGAEIIATADTPEQTQDLMDSSRLTLDQILPEKPETIRARVKTITRGRGVSVIVDTSPSNLSHASYECIAPFGIIVELGKYSSPQEISNESCRSIKNATCARFDLSSLLAFITSNFPDVLRKVMSLIEGDLIRPNHSITSMDLTESQKFMESNIYSNVSSKVVLEVSPSTVVMATPALPRLLYLSPSDTYVIVSDLVDFGFDVCDFFAERGARYIILFLIGSFDQERLRLLERDFQYPDVHLQSVMWNLDNCTDVNVQTLFSGQPMTKGLVRVVAGSKTAGEVEVNDTDDHSVALQHSLSACLLQKFPKECKLDFEVELYSNPTPLAYSKLSSKPVATLSIGPIERSGFDRRLKASRPSTSCYLLPMQGAQVLILLEYVLSRPIGSQHFVCGISKQALETPDDDERQQDAVFNHLHQVMPAVEEGRKVTLEPKEERLADAANSTEACRIVMAALRQKLSTFVAIDASMIDLDLALEELGLDSLVTFSLRNWIFQNFKADLAAQEILEASSLYALTDMIIRYSQVQHTQNSQHQVWNRKMTPNDVPNSGEATDPCDLPRQPLPSLKESLQQFLECAQPFFPQDELTKTNQAIEHFGEPSGIGAKLQGRLSRKSTDPYIDNWLVDLYLSRRFLRSRAPLVACQSYFGTHPAGKTPHQQAQRAAIVSSAALNFKAALDSGQLEPQTLSGRLVDSNSYQWLFNTCREPHLGEDKIHKYPSSNYIVVLRRGHSFKLSLAGDGVHVEVETLRAAFENILRLSLKEESWISVLTADGRDHWADLRRHLLGIGDQNCCSVRDIDAAAFVVCLDSARPESPQQRCTQFLHADGSNRWFDKTLQFVVCENGVSASVCEHSLLDGLTVEPLHAYINEAILSYDRMENEVLDVDACKINYEIQRLLLHTDAIIDMAIHQFRHDFQAKTLRYDFAFLEIRELSGNLLREWKCPVQSGIQLAIQLACRRFFGHNPPALETVSMAHFLKGRVEVNHIIQPSVETFLAAVNNSPTDLGTLRSMLYEAARSHARSLTRASNGRGFSRHLLAMEWMVQDGEDVPNLFKDPVYLRMKSGKVLTSCFTTGWQEGGFVYPVPESILVYFEVEDNRVKFSVFGHDVKAEVFCPLLEAAARQIRDILVQKSI